MTLSLVLGRDEAVAGWVRRRMPWVDDFGACRAIGVADGLRPIAGIVYYDWREPDIRVAIAADHPRWCRRGILAGLFAYPFVTLGARRITTIIPAGNERSQRLCMGLGFVHEGRHPECLPDGETAFSFGLLRRNCRWLPQEMIADGLRIAA